MGLLGVRAPPAGRCHLDVGAVRHSASEPGSAHLSSGACRPHPVAGKPSREPKPCETPSTKASTLVTGAALRPPAGRAESDMLLNGLGGRDMGYNSRVDGVRREQLVRGA